MTFPLPWLFKYPLNIAFFCIEQDLAQILRRQVIFNGVNACVDYKVVQRLNSCWHDSFPAGRLSIQRLMTNFGLTLTNSGVNSGQKGHFSPSGFPWNHRQEHLLRFGWRLPAGADATAAHRWPFPVSSNRCHRPIKCWHKFDKSDMALEISLGMYTVQLLLSVWDRG